MLGDLRNGFVCSSLHCADNCHYFIFFVQKLLKINGKLIKIQLSLQPFNAIWSSKTNFTKAGNIALRFNYTNLSEGRECKCDVLWFLSYRGVDISLQRNKQESSRAKSLVIINSPQTAHNLCIMKIIKCNKYVNERNRNIWKKENSYPKRIFYLFFLWKQA